MAFKIVLCLAALLVCAQAKPGGPAAYSISAPSVDHASVGSTHEHTVKGPYGQTSQSDYTSQVQTAHSQSHVQRSSSSHDAGLAPHGQVIAAAAPIAHYAPAPTYAHGYAPALSLGHALGPALSYGASYGAAYGHGYGPALSLGHGLGAAVSYAAPYGHGYATAPAVSHSYIASAPSAIKIAAAPAYAAPAYAYGHGLGLPAAHYAAPAYPAYAAPAYAAPAYAAPVVKAAVGPALVHASVSGHGVHYGY
jgi:hypothetical protein